MATRPTRSRRTTARLLEYDLGDGSTSSDTTDEEDLSAAAAAAGSQSPAIRQRRTATEVTEQGGGQQGCPSGVRIEIERIRTERRSKTRRQRQDRTSDRQRRQDRASDPVDVAAMSSNLRKPPMGTMSVYAYDTTAALMKFADASGAFACMDDDGNIRIRTLTIDDLDRCITTFQKRMDVTQQIGGCASCGVLLIGEEKRIVDLKRLDQLKFSQQVLLWALMDADKACVSPHSVCFHSA